MAGEQATRSDPEISRLLDEIIVHPRVATYACASWQSEGERGLGLAGAARHDSIFDLASLTKPCTALLALELVQQGLLDLTTPLGALLPELDSSAMGAASLEQLLSHRANLPAHLELFREPQAGGSVDRKELLRRIAGAELRTERKRAPAHALYSDLGYMLVGEALERVGGAALDDLLRHFVTGPLGLSEQLDSARGWLRRTPNYLLRAVPSEDVPERGGEVRGLAHDDNAWAIWGTGLAGHAGLFGTLEGVTSLAALLSRGASGQGPFSHHAQTMLKRRPGGTLLLGLDGTSQPNSVAGRKAEVGTFGHLGFTGTSFWCDPSSGVTTVLLTNRTHPSRRWPARMRSARPRIHDQLRALAFPESAT